MSMLQDFLKCANASAPVQSPQSRNDSASSSTGVTLIAGGPPSTITTEPDLDFVAPKDPQVYSTPARALVRQGGFDKVDNDGVVSPSPRLPTSFAGLYRCGRSPEEDTPRTAKRIKIHTDKVCESNNLTLEDCQEVRKFSKLKNRERDIRIFAELKGIRSGMAQQKELEKEERKKLLIAKLSEHGFRNAISGRMLSCLLSPDITAYVGEKTNEAVMVCTPHFETFLSPKKFQNLVSDQPDLFNLPEGFLEIPACYEGLRAMVTDLLSVQRGNIKARIAASMGDTPKSSKKARSGESPWVPIHELCKTLAVNTSGMEIKGDMWARVAFLASCALIQVTLLN
ncbi:hypothetical protein PQX77_012874 [Marasmius sp. AFHP31]|nr:hypothetical protein PQX77_012874 [Marasmius sp. AFHP31]